MSLAKTHSFRASMEAAEIIAEHYEIVRVINSYLLSLIEASRGEEKLVILIDCVTMECALDIYGPCKFGVKEKKIMLRNASLEEMKAALSKHLKEDK